MESIAANEELDYLVRALSHDMSANFMLLENSFSHLKRSLQGRSALSEGGCAQFAHTEIATRMTHVEACLRESKRFLLDLVQLGRTGKVEMEPEPVDLAAVVDDVLFEHRELLRQQRVFVDVEIPPTIVMCNRGRLKQVVTNLLRNAIHHGCDPRRPRISIATAAPEDRESMPRNVAFRVHDNGTGIPIEHRDEVFLPGCRLVACNAEGSGMGLAIVKKIVHYYDGTVEIDSSCIKGTSFVVTLPRPDMDVDERRESPRPESAHTRSLRGDLQFDGRHASTPTQPHTTVSTSSQQE